MNKWWLFRCTFYYWVLGDLVTWAHCRDLAEKTLKNQGSDLKPYEAMKLEHPGAYL